MDCQGASTLSRLNGAEAGNNDPTRGLSILVSFSNNRISSRQQKTRPVETASSNVSTPLIDDHPFPF
jgi:hypothetical protein